MAVREGFGSSRAAVLAMAGSAIGLGNIWRFPFLVGQNGGAAFILAYIICAIFLSLPIFYAEALIGRRSGAGAIGAMKKLAPGSRWRLIGYLIIIAPMIILSYYSVVGGWSVEFFREAVCGGFSADNATTRFSTFISSTWGPILAHTIFMGLSAIIVIAGVKKGIEKFNNLSLPVLFVLILAIAIYSVTLPGSSEGVRYLVKPDFSAFTPKTMCYAMGQGFFSLSLGVGTVLTYASYMKKDDSMVRSGFGTLVFDLLFAVLAGFAVMPAVFSAGIEPGAGPGLIFESLPYIFATMGASAPVLSRAVSIVFFFVIIIAALTSSISLFEVGTAYLVEEKGLSRKKASALVFTLTWTLGILCSLSFGPLSGVKIAGMQIFSFCDTLTSNYLMTLGGLLFVIFVGWKMKKADVADELTNGGTLPASSRIFPVIYFLIRYVAPVAIIAIFVSNLVI